MRGRSSGSPTSTGCGLYAPRGRRRLRPSGGRPRQEGHDMSGTSACRGARGFQVEREGETVIMTPPKDLPRLDGQESRQWASEVLRPLGGTPAKNVVVDLRRAGPFGPAALSLYLGLWKGVRDRDG